MNMCSDHCTGFAGSDSACFSPTPPGMRDPRTAEFLGLTAATSGAMEPW